MQSFTLKLIDSSIYEDSKKVIERLQNIEKEIVPLFKEVQTHENQLQIMVDHVNQPAMEKAYIETHKKLHILISNYTLQYREIKEQLFKLITSVMKKDKQKRLLG